MKPCAFNPNTPDPFPYNFFSISERRMKKGRGRIELVAHRQNRPKHLQREKDDYKLKPHIARVAKQSQRQL